MYDLPDDAELDEDLLCEEFDNPWDSDGEDEDDYLETVQAEYENIVKAGLGLP